jgi:hypothetical protein
MIIVIKSRGNYESVRHISVFHLVLTKAELSSCFLLVECLRHYQILNFFLITLIIMPLFRGNVNNLNLELYVNSLNLWTSSIFHKRNEFKCYTTSTEPHRTRDYAAAFLRYRGHNDTPHSVGLFGQGISPSQRALPDNTQHSQEKDIHALRDIRIRNPSSRGVADACRTPRGELRSFYRIVLPEFVVQMWKKLSRI